MHDEKRGNGEDAQQISYGLKEPNEYEYIPEIILAAVLFQENK